MPIIVPTAGRVVHYFANGGETSLNCRKGVPLGAIVAHVWGDRMVNLTVFDSNGIPTNRTSVTLVQEGDSIPSGPYCAWMDYQKKVAAGEIPSTLHKPAKSMTGAASDHPDVVKTSTTTGEGA